MNSKEKRIEETLQSIENIKQANASPQLYEQVTQRLKNQERKIVSIRPQAMWRAAACIALLIGLNAFTLLRNKNSNEAPRTENNSFATEYFSYLNQL